jgi:carbamoyl-phosphate synthase large subunit
MELNILITSISRKIWLIKAFKDALREEGIRGKIISSDISLLSAGLYVSDKHYITHPSTAEGFISEIIGICKKENIKLLVPTRNGELPVFAANKEKFEKKGTRVMVSMLDVIETCNDKYKLYRFLKKNDIPTPVTFLPHELDFAPSRYPLLVKSRGGSGSKDVFKVKNEKELKFFIDYVPDPIVQEFIEGKEYTVDVFSDFKGKVLSVVPRERIEMVAGESYKAKTVKDIRIIEFAKNFAEKAGTVGHITMQLIKTGGSIKLIEVNPRFGGAAILGIKSGNNTPLLLVRLIAAKKVESQIGIFKENLIMLRYTKDIFISDGEVVEGL